MNLNDLPDMSDALKQVQMYEAKKKGDGNLANNAVPYDKVTKADIIVGAVGRDEEGGKKKPKGHDCAKLVKYAPDGGVKEEFETIPEQHTLLEDGTVTHYDITDGEWIYENVPVEELEIVISEKHEHFVNYDKNAEVLGENRAAARAAGGYKDDSKKQPDPSKAGFTGVGNMSIDQIRKMSARIEKEKNDKNKKEEVEQYVDFLIDEGYDCSELTWEEISEEYESLDEGLRSAVKRLLGKKDAPAEKKPESRGEQLRKKYNVGPEKSDTSAKMQILKRTRAKAERDRAEFGGSRYSKSVSDKSAAAHDRYLRAGYSKYGADDRRGSGNKARKRAAALQNNAFAFSDAEWQELAMLGEEIDIMTDEQLIDFMEEIILEVAEDDQDLLEICEALEEVEILSEDRYADAAAASKANSQKPEVKAANRRARVERMKSAAKSAATRVGSAVKAGAKMAGSAAKKGAKAAIGAGARAAGHAKGEFEAQRIKSKRAAMERTPAKKKEASKSSDDDGTGGKLDALLKSTRGTSSSSDSGSKSGGGGESSSSSGSSSSSSSGSTRKAVGGALRAVGSLVKKGLKKAVGKTARAVSSGSDRLAKRLGEDYEQIAHLYESGLFSIQEIENVIEEGYKEIDRDKENRMYRRAGNLARTSLSAKGKAKRVAQDKSAKIVSAITSQKERERFNKMGDEKARDNYGG